jgi:hypothetical protein
MKQIRIIIAIAAFSVLNMTQLSAADTTENPTVLPVELKLVGTFNNQPLVSLSFTGASADKAFSISITDEAGIVLYSDDVKGTIFTKQFLLNTDDLGDAVLLFEITGKNTGQVVQYKVSRQRNVSAQLDVVKL